MREKHVENAKITRADLSMADHGVLCFEIGLVGQDWSCTFGGYVLGSGYLGAKEFNGWSPKSIEALMRIMDTVGVERWSQLEGKYVRAETEGWGSIIHKIGNIIEDKWFDAEEFFVKCSTC